VLRRLTEDEWDQWRALRLAALAEAPYAFSTALAQWTGAGDLEKRWRSRLTDVPCNVVAQLGRMAVGMASCTSPTDGQAELISMWVDPHARGKGVGEALIEDVATWAGSHGARLLVLSVRELNEPAIRLYRRCGFADAGPADQDDEEPAERKMVRRIAR